MLLFKVLKEIAQEGKYSSYNISNKLGISEGLVQHMIDKLIEMGYLVKVNSNCSCSSCKGNCGCCSSNVELNIIEITEKGKNALKEM